MLPNTSREIGLTTKSEQYADEKILEFVNYVDTLWHIWLAGDHWRRIHV